MEVINMTHLLFTTRRLQRINVFTNSADCVQDPPSTFQEPFFPNIDFSLGLSR